MEQFPTLFDIGSTSDLLLCSLLMLQAALDDSMMRITVSALVTYCHQEKEAWCWRFVHQALKGYIPLMERDKDRKKDDRRGKERRRTGEDLKTKVFDFAHHSDLPIRFSLAGEQ